MRHARTLRLSVGSLLCLTLGTFPSPSSSTKHAKKLPKHFLSDHFTKNEWVRGLHPYNINEAAYHGYPHSFEAAKLAYRMAKGEGLDEERALLLARIGLLHDLDPTRPHLTPARVPATIEWMHSADGREFTRKWGWTERERIIAMAIIERTQYPYADIPVPTTIIYDSDKQALTPAAIERIANHYAKRSPYRRVKDLVKKLPRTDQAFTLEWGAKFSEFADKLNAYLRRPNLALQSTKALAKELKFDVVPTTHMFIQGIGTVNEQANPYYWDEVMAQQLKLRFERPDKERLMGHLTPSQLANHDSNIGMFEAIGSGMDEEQAVLAALAQAKQLRLQKIIPKRKRKTVRPPVASEVLIAKAQDSPSVTLPANFLSTHLSKVEKAALFKDPPGGLPSYFSSERALASAKLTYRLAKKQGLGDPAALQLAEITLLLNIDPTRNDGTVPRVAATYAWLGSRAAEELTSRWGWSARDRAIARAFVIRSEYPFTDIVGETPVGDAEALSPLVKEQVRGFFAKRSPQERYLQQLQGLLPEERTFVLAWAPILAEYSLKLPSYTVPPEKSVEYVTSLGTLQNTDYLTTTHGFMSSIGSDAAFQPDRRTARSLKTTFSVPPTIDAIQQALSKKEQKNLQQNKQLYLLLGAGLSRDAALAQINERPGSTPRDHQAPPFLPMAIP